jgi:hypothetical protein
LISPDPKRGSAARRTRSATSAARAAAFDAPSATTISTGSVVACGKSRCSSANPRFATKRSGSVLTPLVPILKPKIGDAARSSAAVATVKLMPACLWTVPTTRFQ